MNQNRLGSIHERLLHLIRYLVEEQNFTAIQVVAILEKPWHWQDEADAIWDNKDLQSLIEGEDHVNA